MCKKDSLLCAKIAHKLCRHDIPFSVTIKVSYHEDRVDAYLFLDRKEFVT
jgi:hypothetical protein